MIQSVINERKQTAKSLVIVGAGGAIGQIATVLFNPILTRLYTPESYGQWALLLSLALLATTISSLRYELAILLPDTHEEAANVLAWSILVSLILALGTLCSISLLHNFLVGSLGLHSLAGWLWWIPVLVVATGIYQSSISWCTRMKDFAYFSLALATLPLLTISVQIFAALNGWQDARGLFLGSLLGQIGATCVMVAIITYNYHSFILKSLSWRLTWQMMIRYKNYALYMTPYSLIGMIRNRMAVLILSSVGATIQVGYYAFSDRVVRLPGNFISDSVRPIFFQKAAKNKLKTLEPAILESLLLINRWATPFFVLFVFEAFELFAMIFGEEWRNAGLYGIILAFPAFVLLHTNWLDRGLDVLGRQNLAFQLEAFFSVLSVCFLIFGVYVLQTVFYGVLLQAMVFLAYNICWCVTFFKVAEFRIKNLWVLAGQCLIIAAVCSTLYLVLEWALPTRVAIIVYLLLAGLAVAQRLKKEWVKLNLKVTALETANKNDSFSPDQA